MGEPAIKTKTHKLPFEIQLELNGVAQKVLIHKIEPIGALIEVFVPNLKALQHFSFKIQLPLDGLNFEEEAIIVKTYNKYKEVKKDGKVYVQKDQIQYLVEVHFKRPSLQTQDAIENFLKRSEKKVMTQE